MKMSLQVDDPLVERMAQLAELPLSEEEREQAKQDMTDMISFLDRLDGAALEGVEPLYQVNPAENVFREDVISAGKKFREDAISAEKGYREKASGANVIAEEAEGLSPWLKRNAPDSEGTYFVVPRTIGT